MTRRDWSAELPAEFLDAIGPAGVRSLWKDSEGFFQCTLATSSGLADLGYRWRPEARSTLIGVVYRNPRRAVANDPASGPRGVIYDWSPSPEHAARWIAERRDAGAALGYPGGALSGASGGIISAFFGLLAAIAGGILYVINQRPKS